MNLIKSLMRYKIFILVLSIGFFACSKGGDSPATPSKPTVEPDLAAANAVKVDIDPGPTNIYIVSGASQKIEIKLVAIPESGVTIDTKLINPLKNDTVFKNNFSSKSLTPPPVIVTGLLPYVLYNLMVVVKSQTTATNFKIIQFQMATK
jgi:hypothetical protein